MSDQFLSLLYELGRACLIPLFAYLATVLIDKIKKKIEAEEKKAKTETAERYLAQLNETILICVNATIQTYVAALKEAGSFDKTAQEEALKKTLSAVKATLSAEAVTYLKMFTSDLDTFITNKIEAIIHEKHNSK